MKQLPEFDADELDGLRAVGWAPVAGDTSCPDPSLLMASDADVLDDATAARVRAHAATCPTCQMLVADLGQLLDEEVNAAERDRITARVEQGQAVSRPGRSRLLWGLTTGGLLAAASIAGFLVMTSRSVAPLEVGSPSGAGAASGAASVTVFKADRPVLARPEPELTLRGESTPAPVAERIGAALDRADAGDSTGAISQLDGLVRQNPTSADAHLALGATLLRADRVAEALPVLDRARSLAGTTASDEFDWFLASALVRSREMARATAILEPLCRHNTLRGALACAGLVEIKRPPR